MQPTTQFFGGSNSTSTTTRKPLYTGLNVFTVLGVNPTKEQIEEWTGSEYKLKVDYTIQTINDKRLRPIEVWVKSVDDYVKAESLRFLVGTQPDVNQNGTTRYVNSLGEFCFSKVDPIENDKMGWFTKNTYRVAIQGEYELYNFMQKLMRYNSREAASNFMGDAETMGITIQSLYDGNIDALRTFFDWCNSNDNMITLLCAVKRNIKVDENNKSRIYDSQIVVNNPEYFYRATNKSVSEYAFKDIAEAIEKGRRVTNSLFTITFQDFVEENCLNKVPANPATEVGDAPAVQSFKSWMPK